MKKYCKDCTYLYELRNRRRYCGKQTGLKDKAYSQEKEVIFDYEKQNKNNDCIFYKKIGLLEKIFTL